ncbi:MAG: alcohol dehydrogenase catalytic domain-containing protein [Planctomycetes bacterium]|nr:alcohol dehydrogenase catalytic domain-containing protein [Planctomycetota bacterium]
MQALLIEAGKVRYTNSHQTPAPQNDQVLIEVIQAGICSTDLEIVKGYMNFSGVMGHEFVGTVVGGAPDLKGKKVVGEINCVCGKCDMCQSGLSNHCRARQVLGIHNKDGAFAEYLTLPRRNIHVLADSVDNDQAIFVEPLAAALQIVKQVPLESRQKVIVVGDGRLGLLSVQVLAHYGGKGKVVLLGKHEEKIMFAEKRGIQGILLQDMLIKPQWDVVVDCTGSPEGFATACQLVRPRGKLILKSTLAAQQPIDLTPLVIDEITLIGSRCGPFPDAINALAAEQAVVHGLITSRFKLANWEKAFQKAADSNQIKVVLEIKN